MAILTHGSDLTLAPTIRPVVKQTDGTVQTALTRLAEGGFRAVQLDATLPGVRPRDLDVRARKDLAALLTRRGLRLAGLDCFVPRKHFVQPENADRAMAALLATIELAADLGRVPVSLALPVANLAEDMRKAIVEAADGHGIRLAVHAEDSIDDLLQWTDTTDQPALGIGLDPASALVQGREPAALVHRLRSRLAVARLSDVAGSRASGESEIDTSGLRSTIGEGDLDVIAYRIALDLAGGRTGPVVLDLRGMENPLAAAAQAKIVWEKAAFTT